MHEVMYFLGIAWVAFCFAKVEIAIEGPSGWAENLPTWRLPPEHWASLLFFGGKPLTGYHVWLEIFILSILHIVYVYTPYSLGIELQILAWFCFFSVFEDFLWFALNPAYGIQKFRPENIWWHKKGWLWIAPRDYYVLLVIGVALFTASLYIP